MPRIKTRLTSDQVFDTQIQTDLRYSNAVDELRDALLTGRKYLEAVDLLQVAIASQAEPGSRDRIPRSLVPLLQQLRGSVPQPADLVEMRAGLARAGLSGDAVLSRLEALSRDFQVTSEALRLLSELDTPGGAVPAKMVIAGRLLERGWLVAQRNARPHPFTPEKRKAILLQVDRRIWSELAREQTMTGIPLRDLGTMYLGLGLSWPADDLPLTLSSAGYSHLLDTEGARS